MSTPQSPARPRPRNALLGGLAPDELARVAPHLVPMPFAAGQVLYDIDAPIRDVYFVEHGVVSIVGAMVDGVAVEAATVGNEGFVGVPLFLGVDRTPQQALGQVPGAAYRMSADAFAAALGAGGALRDVLGRYTQALFTQVAQGSACNRMHAVEIRCARWLLTTHDRVGAERGVNEFQLTHRFLAQMLGVRRATVSEAAAALQARGLITYEYGRIRIADRAGLERAACECYRIIRREFDRLVAGVAAGPSPLAGVVTADDAGRSTLGPTGAAVDDARAA